MPRTILFLGATGGVALSTLRRSLAAGHTCIALCRTPSKLQTLVVTTEETSTLPPNLAIEKGNAHSLDDLARCLTSVRGPVDTVVSSIGGAMQFSKMTLDDPHVCETGMKTLLSAIAQARNTTTSCSSNPAAFSPRIIAVSTIGVSEATRDVPVLLVPLYATLIKHPRRDKKAMEKLLIGSGEKNWTIVRPVLFTDGPETKGNTVREGIEDPVEGKVEEKMPTGYTISRADVGRWIFEKLVEREEDKYVRRAIWISY